MEYVAHLAKEGRRTLIDFRDCPGCQTFAEAGEDVLASAREALEGWLEAHLIVGAAPPRPNPKAYKNKDRLSVRIGPLLAVRLQLRWARQDAGLSQAELAKRVGVTRQQIALLESPNANVTLRTLDKVARAMDLELEIGLQSGASAA